MYKVEISWHFGELGPHVFTANLKKSVTIAVEPLRVIAWRVGACFVACFVAMTYQQMNRLLEINIPERAQSKRCDG